MRKNWGLLISIIVGSMTTLAFGNISKIESHICNENSDEPWCIPKDYDSKVDPIIYKNKSKISLPWNYSYDFWLMEVAEINDKQQRISFLMYFITEWYEPRLVINDNSPEWKDDMDNNTKTLNIPLGTKLWLPDLEIYGLRSFDTREVYSDKKLGWFKIKRDKLLRIQYYAEVSTTCKMDFTHFPFDRQICDFLVTSYTNTDDKIKCNSKLITGESLNDYPQRSLQYSVSWKSRNMKRVMTYPTGAWEYCGFEVQLDRVRDKYISGSYIPSCFFVILSWLSFIIKPDAIPGRMMLLLNTFLILVLLINDVKEAAPDSNNFNEMDLYLAICTFHVFGAIFEYAILLFIMKKFELEWKKNGNNDATVQMNDNKVNVQSISGIITTDNMANKRTMFDMTASNISISLFTNLDWISLFLFPISFSIFNAFYWYRLD